MGNSFGPLKNVGSSFHAGNSPVSVLASGSGTTVSDETLTTLRTYTAPAAGATVSHINISGEGPGRVTLELNSTVIDTKRFNNGYTTEWRFEGPLNLAGSDVLDVRVRFNSSDNAETRVFNATIYGRTN